MAWVQLDIQTEKAKTKSLAPPHYRQKLIQGVS